MKTKPQLLTPVGLAIFPHLHKPNTKFNKGTWEVNLRLNTSDAATLSKEIKKHSQGKIPVKPANKYDKTILKGYYDFKFTRKQFIELKTGDTKENSLPIYDKFGKAWDLEIPIAKEAKIQISFQIFEYGEDEIKISLQMTGVKCLGNKSVEFNIDEL